MTSCMYQHVSSTASSSLRGSIMNHQPASSRVTNAQRCLLYNVKAFPPNHKENSRKLIKDQDHFSSVKLPQSATKRGTLNSNFPFCLPISSEHTSKMKSCANVHLVDKDARFGRFQGGLFSFLDNNQNITKDLKIAPTYSRNLSASIPIPIKGNVAAEEQSNYFGKGGDGESSWNTVAELGALNPGQQNLEHTPSQSSSPLDNVSNIFRAFYNNLQNKTVTYFGNGTMSLSLLLDPIVGSPPPTHSNVGSPIEARDDISALSEGFTRKVKVLRRRLSTSFDEPEARESGGRPVSSTVGHAIEHDGPFGFRSPSKRLDRAAALHEDNEDKKAKLNAWLAQLHEEALLKSHSGGASDGSESGRGSSSEREDDGGDNSSRSSSIASQISEDMFQLLEKVIGYKGRNISHIIIEQSVKDLCTVYMDASDEEKLRFFTILAEKYGVDHDNVTAVATSLASCKGADARLTLEEKLRSALVPKSQWLFTQIGRLENGVKFLVDVRTDLLDAIEKSKGNASLKALNNSLRDLIGMWFNVGFLNLERVTWQSSCDMLQKVSEYEAVHPMRNWTDLKKRVGPNRRCFVYTHNSMPGEPVVVLHTFLTDHIPASVKKIVANHRMRMMSLDAELPMVSAKEDPNFINTAVFYSITSTQRGLTGIELGNYLIKRVVRELQSEFPKMTQYSSLSPIPGFKNWLTSSIKNEMKDFDADSKGTPLLTDHEINTLKPIFQTHGGDKDFYQVFLDLLKVNSWFSDEKLVKELEKPLMRLCAQYLYIVKRRGYALDPVAHFHLKNGAVMWRINWLGDDSPRGLGQSCGMMVNYRYFLDACETNSQNYMENQVIKSSDQVKHLVKLTEM